MKLLPETQFYATTASDTYPRAGGAKSWKETADPQRIELNLIKRTAGLDLKRLGTIYKLMLLFLCLGCRGETYVVSKLYVAEVDGSSLNSEKALHSVSEAQWEEINNWDSIYFEPEKISILRVPLPKNRGEDLVAQFTYAQSDSDDGCCTSALVDRGGTLHSPAEIHGKYFSVIIDREVDAIYYFTSHKPAGISTKSPQAITLLPLSSYANHSAVEDRVFGVFFGIVGVMIVYNLGIYFLFRKIHLLYYICYSVCALVFILYASGMIQKNFLTIALGYYLPIGLGPMSLVLFSQEVLSVSKSSRQAYIFGWILGLSNVAVQIAAISNVDFFAKNCFVVGFFCFAYSFAIALSSALNGYRPAFSLLTGWLILLGMQISALLVFNLGIPVPHFTLVAPAALALESLCFSFAIGHKLRLGEVRALSIVEETLEKYKDLLREKEHAFTEMSKMVYPHQIDLIRGGGVLENTMPTSVGQACVISFDIVGSSKIRHIRAKEFFRNVFARCNEAMSQGYDGKSMKARAYRIKEMGDGFLCSIGYPFESLSGNPAADAIALAEDFARILAEESRMLHSPEPITCGIGIVIDTLTGFYPEAGTKEYDLFGRGLILATRYEGMRKVLFEAERQRSIVIIQEIVYLSLDPSLRAGFEPMNIMEMGVVVRDDPSASKIYYRFLDGAVDGKSLANLRAG